MKTLKVLSIVFLTVLITTIVVIGCKKKTSATCTDGVQNQSEIAVDCGGPCGACATCVDGIQNQNETGVDCGGPCPACGTCSDGIKNHGETGIDCGGPCLACATCSDGIKNQDEVEIDCGGTSCQACAIHYPPTGTYGLNLLYGSDTLWIPGTGNSFKATVPVGSTLKLELSLINGQFWGYANGSGGWTISTFSNNTQTFEALNPGTYDVQIVKFTGTGTGSFMIKFFENSLTETRRKVIVWT